jgi:putative transposase
VSERRACRVLGQHRSTQRKIAKTPDDEAALTADITALALQYGRYGYRRITALLHQAGWIVNVKRVERIWRREGLKVPHKQPKRGRLWLNDSSCVRLRPEYPNHVWSYDFVEDRTHNGRKVRMLNVIDEFTRECIAIRVERKLKAVDVIDVLSDLFILRGIPTHIRSDNGPEFIAKALREWIAAVGAKTAYIMPGSPWENGYCESFNSKPRDELLNGEIFYTLKEAKIIIENWRQHYSTVRPHSSPGYKPPAPEAAAWPLPKRYSANASGGQKAEHALTFQTDHPTGAGQLQGVDTGGPEPMIATRVIERPLALNKGLREDLLSSHLRFCSRTNTVVGVWCEFPSYRPLFQASLATPLTAVGFRSIVKKPRVGVSLFSTHLDDGGSSTGI